MTWQESIKENITNVDQLENHIRILPSEKKVLRRITKLHPMSITKYYLSLIDKNDKNDPIRKMIVPSSDELSLDGNFDTSGEHSNTKAPGLQHKYKQTALILCTNRCAAYCRFCFRKRLVGLSNNEILKRFNDAVSYIKKHKEIDNILITGGDPLILPTETIKKFLELLCSIDHIKYIRFGSRVTVVFPERISGDKELLKVFRKYSKIKKIYVVSHFNHPKELTDEALKSVKLLQDSGIQIVNQTVLMRDINDDPDVLAEAFNRMIDSNILPYYLFQCRPVKRVKKHFAIPLYRGIRIFEAAKKKIKAHIICKRIKYIMSHKTGKVEIVGVIGDEIFFKYHQAKDEKNLGKLFKRRLNKTGSWLDDFKSV